VLVHVERLNARVVELEPAPVMRIAQGCSPETIRETVENRTRQRNHKQICRALPPVLDERVVMPGLCLATVDYDANKCVQLLLVCQVTACKKPDRVCSMVTKLEDENA